MSKAQQSTTSHRSFGQNITPDDLVANRGFLADITLTTNLAITRLKERQKGQQVIVKLVVVKQKD